MPSPDALDGPASKSHGSSDELETEAELDGESEANSTYPSILPTLSHSLAAQTHSPHAAPHDLCTRCAQIDFDTLLSRPDDYFRDRSWDNLSPIEDWSIASCRFCRLLYSLRNETWTARGVELRLLAWSSRDESDKIWSSVRTTTLVKIMEGRRWLVSQPDGMNGPVRVIRENIESFDMVKSWIDFCQKHHTELCSVKNPCSVPGLRLIDCHARAIVPGDTHLYVALSYVWGVNPEVLGESDMLPETLPNTIEDALTVTKSLGYRYLWIDRYCIDQYHEKAKATQVGKMDLIYQNAELTIVAAIGENPTHGLPGVSRRKREAQHLTACTKISEHFLISVEPWPKLAIEGTKWKTRAWTYQEALLSRRRLVFADAQMYLECYGMYCCESLDLPLERLHGPDMQSFKPEFCSHGRVGMFPRGVGTAAKDIFLRVEEYSRLNLTDPADILRGMLGIFNAFQRSPINVHHCAGIPILPSPCNRSPGKRGGAWTRSMAFVQGLAWRLERSSGRRPGFPSWSWTGWYGAVGWDWLGPNAPQIEADPSVDVRVGLVDGRILDMESLLDGGSQGPPLSNTLIIAAWTIEIEISRRMDRSGGDHYESRLKLEDGGYVAWSFPTESVVELMPGDVCTGLILGHNGSHDSVVILVCGMVGDALERIGIGLVDQWNYTYERPGSRESLVGARSSRFQPMSDPLVRSWKEVQLR